MNRVVNRKPNAVFCVFFGPGPETDFFSSSDPLGEKERRSRPTFPVFFALGFFGLGLVEKEKDRNPPISR